MLHLYGGVIVIGHDARRGIAEAGRGAHVFDLIPQDFLDLLEKRADLLLLLVVLFGLQVFRGAASAYRFELHVLVASDYRCHQFVDLVIHDEDFEAPLFVGFQQRGVPQLLLRGSRDVVDRFLFTGHPLLVPLQAGQPLLGRRFVPQQLEKSFPIPEILVHPLFQADAELFVKLLVLGGSIFRHRFQFSEDFLYRGVSDILENLVFLEHLPADVEGKVFGIDDSMREAQVGGKQLFFVIRYEHTLHVQLDAGSVIHKEQIKRGFLGNVEQRRVLQGALGLGVDEVQRVLGVMADRSVELVVVLVLDFVLGFSPESRCGVYLLDLLFSFFSLLSLAFHLFVVQIDGKGNVVGVLLDDRFDLPAVGELLPPFGEEELDGCTVALRGSLLNGERALAVADPLEGGLLSRLSAEHFDFVRHHEHGIEAYPELADQICIIQVLISEGFHELLRTGVGDGSQVFGKLVCIHS